MDITSEQPLLQEPTPSYLNNQVIDTDEPYGKEIEKTNIEDTKAETPTTEMNRGETEAFTINTGSEGKYIKYDQKKKLIGHKSFLSTSSFLNIATYLFIFYS